MARTGGQPEWKGPRLPSGPRDHIEDEIDPEPEVGKRHCLACGSIRDVHDFTLSLRGKRCGYFRLCGPCYYHANPRDPQEADPLQAA
jgi:hypothetical protein